MPGGKDICEKQLFHLVDNMEKTEVDEAQIEPYLPKVYKKLDWLSREDLIKRFVSVEFNHFLEYYKDAKDLNADLRPDRNDRNDRFGRDSRREDRGERRESRRSASSGSFSKVAFNIGKKDNVSPKVLINLINKQLPNRSIRIGAIDLGKSFSIVEVDSKYQREVVEAFRNARFKGLKLEVTIK